MQQEERKRLETLFSSPELSRLATRTGRRTFMEILGVGRTEIVISQVLSFFLDTEAEHGFGALWIESLLKAAFCSDRAFDPELYDLNVERSDTEEVTTMGVDRNLRIDVVVETGDLILGIENKIGASVYNDLESYATYLHAKASGAGKQPMLVLLTQQEEPMAVERWLDACAAQGVPFCNVTYASLFEQIKLGVGPSYLRADPDWLCYMKDFIRTLEGLEDAMPEVDEELFAFVSKRKDEFVLARDRYNEVYNAQVEQGRRLLELIKQDEDIMRLGFGEPRIHKDKSCLWMSVYFNVGLKGVKGSFHPEIGNSVHNTSIRAWTGSSASAKSAVTRVLEQHGREPDEIWEQSLDVEILPITTPDDVLVEKFREFLRILEPHIVKK